RSAVRLSTHPLSKIIYKSIVAECLDADSCKEISGAGVEAVVSGHEIKLGSAVFAGGAQTQTLNETQVHISLDGKYRGYFRVRNSYREDLEKTLQALAKNYTLHILSGDHEGEKDFLKQYISEEKH